MLDKNTYENFGTDQRERSQHPLLRWVEQINSSKDIADQEFSIKQLEMQFKKAEYLSNEDIQTVFNQVDESVRKRLVNSIVESYGFKGEFQIKDATGKMLTVELANPPIALDSTHGWVMKYKTYDDPKDKFSAPIKTNYIASMARFKAATPKSANNYYTNQKAA